MLDERVIGNLRAEHGWNNLEDSLSAMFGQLGPTETVQLPSDVLFNAELRRMQAARKNANSRTIGQAVMTQHNRNLETEWYGDVLRNTPKYPGRRFGWEYYLKVYTSPNDMRQVTEFRVRLVNRERQVAQCFTVNGDPHGGNQNSVVLEDADFNADEWGQMQRDMPRMLRVPEDYPSRLIIPRTTRKQPNVYSVLLTDGDGGMNLGEPKTNENLRRKMRRIRKKNTP